MKDRTPPIVRKTKKGRIAQPQIHCGPGQNCKNASASSSRLIEAILGSGTGKADSQHLQSCLDQSVCRLNLEP